MTFLNPLLLLGGLGLALPILAHLLNRFEVKQTDWAAMQFLNRSVRVRSRQLRLRDLLLLILRCLALLLFCLALARPGWKGQAAAWVRGERRHPLHTGRSRRVSSLSRSTGATRSHW